MPHRRYIARIRGEFLEMPGLRLTIGQAQRLCGVDRAMCQAVLDALVDAGFLDARADGTYARAGEGRGPRDGIDRT
jgi:hypothetical protein